MTAPFVVVLGVAQDGGHPQPGCRRPCRADPSRRRLLVSLGLVDGDRRWLFDCIPARPSGGR